MMGEALSTVGADTETSPTTGLPLDVADFQTLSLRPLDVSDADAILRHFGAFDSFDRFARFFSSRSDAGLKNFVEGFDWSRMIAVGAFAEDRLVGLAELGWEEGDDGSLAELAFSVSPDWRNRGIGTWAARRVCHEARGRGVRRIFAIWLGDNAAAFRIMRALDAWIARDGQVMRGELDLVRKFFADNGA
jgi:RimJ/RimL family protein N-acetyltransferase